MKAGRFKGPDEAGLDKKAAGGKTHKGIKGPSAMHAAGAHGPKHKAIKGPSEMKEAHLGKEPMKHEADMINKEHSGHLGHFAKPEHLKKGHNTVEKMPMHEVGSYAEPKGKGRY